ncbi:site-specific integrase [Methylotenera sp.]|uniref:tyrosine-type recombinase/integrase n=1 Tax=Methylotenera sp. TaxID=2051956 RepID=UPI002734BF0C|nr:site-specific integrase [Methylotenera sp.]MDP3308625.1 site-specific integrase [Methylotenera sp.]
MKQRLEEGQLLNPWEIEELVYICKSTLAATLASPTNLITLNPKKILSLEKARMAMTRRKVASDVDPSTAAIRLNYIREFLAWRVTQAILQAPVNKRSNLIILKEITDLALRNKTPQVTGRNHLYQRLGLDTETHKQLLNLIDIENPESVWVSTHTKVRNVLIVRMLLELGVRRSELLGVRIKDISAQGHEIKILRRPDDIHDPRLYEPNTKTRDRLLALSQDMFLQISNYLSTRRNILGARRHDFLLVANGTGAPLSISEFNRLFKPLQVTTPSLQYLTPHLLRHTFFENLCESLDKNGIPVEEWDPMLRRLGGWSDTSTTPSRYTKRYAQRKANEAMLSMQQRLKMKVSHNE